MQQKDCKSNSDEDNLSLPISDAMSRTKQSPARKPHAGGQRMQRSAQEAAALFTHAYGLHRQGKLAEASQGYERVLEKDPYDFDALHLLGVIAARSKDTARAVDLLTRAIAVNPKVAAAHSNLGAALKELRRLEEAVTSYERAIELDPNTAEAYSNRGNALQELGRLEEAVASYDRAIALKPDYADALYNRGNALRHLKRLDEAVASYERALQFKPDHAEAWSNRGIALNDLLRHEEAVVSHERVIGLKPDHAEAWSNRGIALNALKRHEEALASYERAIELKPDYAEGWGNRGTALHDLKRHEEALASYGRAIAIAPDYLEACRNRGIALHALKRYEAAVASYERALELKPDYAEAWSNRGIALNDLKRHREALASYDRAIELKPDYAEAWGNRGTALHDLERHEESLASYDRAIELKPDYAQAFYNKGLLQLSKRQFPEGFKNYLRRWEGDKSTSKNIQTPSLACSPDSLHGRVLLRAEQGLGDEIFYASMLAQANSVCSQITLSADKRLHSIFRRSFPGIDVIDRNINIEPDHAKSFDAQASIGDLGYLLGMTEESIAKSRRAFLLPDSAETLKMKNCLPFMSGKRVFGLSWKSANQQFGDAKSINLGDFERLLGNQDDSFVNLQYGEVDADIRHVNDRLGSSIHRIEGLDVFNDVDGLLSLIDACDLIITTSNVTAHLAGSIGKKGCVLVPFSKGKIWYWHLNDVYSFWYPSLKIFYQDNPYSWSSTIDQMMDWLEGVAHE